MPHTPRQREGHRRHYLMRDLARVEALKQGVRLTQAEEREGARRLKKEGPLPQTRAFWDRYLAPLE